MSIEVMNDVWRYSKAKGTDRLVLIALADQANDQRECWPSVSSIGKKCLLTPRNVQKRIRSLEELGEVIVIYGAGTSSSKGGVRSNRYRIIVYMADPDPVGADTISTPQTLSDATPSESDDPVASDTQTLSDATPRTPSPATPEPKGEPSLNPQSLATDDLTVAVAKVCGLELDHLTSSARGALERAVKEIADAGGTVTQVGDRASHYHRKFPTATLTPPALAKHWPVLVDAGTDSSVVNMTVPFPVHIGQTAALTITDRDQALEYVRDALFDEEDIAWAMKTWEARRMAGVF